MIVTLVSHYLHLWAGAQLRCNYLWLGGSSQEQVITSLVFLKTNISHTLFFSPQLTDLSVTSWLLYFYFHFLFYQSTLPIFFFIISFFISSSNFFAYAGACAEWQSIAIKPRRILKAPPLISSGLNISGLQERPDRGALDMFENMFEKVKFIFTGPIGPRVPSGSNLQDLDNYFQCCALLFTFSFLCHFNWLCPSILNFEAKSHSLDPGGDWSWELFFSNSAIRATMLWFFSNMF